MKRLLVTLLVVLFMHGCGNKIDEKDPISVIQNFILLCESGNIDEAEKLLAPNNNVDYFRKYKNLNGGKDMMYIDYDYKGNDDVIELSYEFLENLSSKDQAVVKLTSNYLEQNQKFDKVIVLKNIDNRWHIYEFLFMPVKVRGNI